MDDITREICHIWQTLYWCLGHNNQELCAYNYVHIMVYNSAMGQLNKLVFRRPFPESDLVNLIILFQCYSLDMESCHQLHWMHLQPSIVPLTCPEGCTAARMTLETQSKQQPCRQVQGHCVCDYGIQKHHGAIE